jgi:hypothetical protein
MAVPIQDAYVGSWNGIQMYAKAFSPGGKLYIANTTVSSAPAGSTVLVPRGKEIVSDGGWTMASGYVVADFASYSTSGGNGTGIPTDLATTPNGWAKMQDNWGGYFQKVETTTTDTNGDGVIDEKDKARSANSFDKAIDWVKANPLLAAGIVLGVYLVFFAKKGKKKKLFGLL